MLHRFAGPTLNCAPSEVRSQTRRYPGAPRAAFRAARRPERQTGFSGFGAVGFRPPARRGTGERDIERKTGKERPW
jgi:hypothetical protein